MRWMVIVVLILGGGCAAWVLKNRTPGSSAMSGVASSDSFPTFTPERSEQAGQTATATFGSGCFWCTEAVFEQLDGVSDVVSGYSGGASADPSYEEVCSGVTGHAEVVQVTYDPQRVSYPELLDLFWRTHDPTTPNRQGNDVGTQYRSVIYYHDDEQKRLAERYKSELDASGVFGAPIVTEIAPLREFYRAEGYHQDYFARNPNQPYCTMLIRPKIEKVKSLLRAKKG